MRRHPTLFLILFLITTAIACQGLSTLSETAVSSAVDVNTDQIVQEAVATVIAQLPEPVISPAINEDTLSPISESLLGMDMALQDALIHVYEQVNPSVVHILVSVDDIPVPIGSGSGFVYDSDGHIVTNNHVVADGDSFEVVFADGVRQNATVVGTDIDSDLAVIRVDALPPNVEPVSLSNSNLLQVGQFAIAIGNPFGEVGSMSIGIISGLGRTIQSQRLTEDGGRYTLPQVIQTDAAINPGNSGGPLLNLAGEVIGVNSSILTRTGENSGVGFSIPVNAVSRIVPSLIANGRYTYPYIGISMRSAASLTQELLESTGIGNTPGVYVTIVMADTPAAEAGLIGVTGPGGDLITAVDGDPIRSSDDLISYLIFETEVNQIINLTVLRDNEEIMIPLKLGARP